MALNSSSDSRSFKLVSLWIVMTILVAGTFMSALIPPFQSPDEFDHLKRAYFLGHGQILLDAPQGKQSGGMIDEGLAAYISAYTGFQGRGEARLYMERVEAARIIRWRGRPTFVESAGSASYFPIAYAPQAIGLVLGEKLNLGVDYSYRLARLAALIAIALTLLLAFWIYHANPLVIALLVLPMSLFQFSSATLDGFTNALTLLVLSISLHIAAQKGNARPWLFPTLIGAVIVLVGARLHLLPMLLLVFYAAHRSGQKKNLILAVLATLFIFGWIGLAMKTTVDHRVTLGMSTGRLVMFYVQQPAAFWNVMQTTFTDTGLVRFYRESFLGVLGWLDTPLRPEIYTHLGVVILLIAVATISWQSWKEDRAQRLLLVVCALLSVLLIFFALLVTWTVHPARVVDGVQGRYFYGPAFILAYALSGGIAVAANTIRKAALVLTAALSWYSIQVTGLALIDRYYLALAPVKTLAVAVKPGAVNTDLALRLNLLKEQVSEPRHLKRVGILFGTGDRHLKGGAKLELVANDGRVETIPFKLAALEDNAYYFWRLDPLPYTSGEVYFDGGDEVIAWEAHYADGTVATCMVYEFTDDEKRFTPGCPRF